MGRRPIISGSLLVPDVYQNQIARLARAIRYLILYQDMIRSKAVTDVSSVNV
jgi:hypothetical protein